MLSPGVVVADRYRCVRILGTGGLAEVWLVEHVDLGHRLALKLLTLRRPLLSDRLLQEGRIQARLCHANVVAVQDVVRFEGLVGLVMEYVDGPTLEDWMARTGPLALEDALALFTPILGASAAAHRVGILHRDLKPANVLLASTSVGVVPKVADFGLAKVLEGSLREHDTRMGAVMGTPGYLAPEQGVDASTVDARADVFALAAMFWEAMTGRPAFDRATLGTGYVAPRPLSTLVPGLPGYVSDAIAEGMELDPEERTASVGALAEALLAKHPALLARFQALETGSSSVEPSPVDVGHTILPDEGAYGSLDAEPSRAAPTTAPEDTPPPPPVVVPAVTVMGAPPAPGAGPPTPAETVVLPPPASSPSSSKGGLIALLVFGALAVAVGGWYLTRPPPPVEGPSERVVTSVRAVPGRAAEPVPEPEPVAAPVPEVAPEPVAAPVPVPEVAPEPTPEPVAVDPDPEPEAAPVPVAPPPAIPVDEDAVAVIEEPPPPPPAEPPRVVGTWRGDAGGRSVRITLDRQQGGSVGGEVVFTLGPTERAYAVTGVVGADGRVRLTAPEDALVMEAWLEGEALGGTYLTPGARREVAFTARRGS